MTLDGFDLDEAAALVHRLTQQLAVEVAAVVPVVAGRFQAPLLIGTGTSCSVGATPAQVFRPALWMGAAAVVLAHNHVTESGGPTPADDAVTRRLVAAGAVLGVPLVAHVVAERSRWFDCLETIASPRRYPATPQSLA